MWKVNFGVVICLTLIPSLVLSVALRDSYVKAYDHTRRVSNAASQKGGNFLLSGLYNKQGSAHDLGSDFGLTSDVYTKPNPFYTKNLVKANSNESKSPVYYPVYNNSVTQDVAATAPEEVFDSPPASYDSKTNTYQTASYSVPSTAYGATYSVHTAPSSSYSVHGSNSYSAPSSSYSGMSPYYPSSAYGFPSSYGSSQPAYSPAPYGPSPTYGPTPTMQMPEAQKSHSEFFLAKIMKKFDLILMSKILLKLIIFKKIVKFIGIICLLLFIPVLKKKFDEHVGNNEEEEERRIKDLDAYASVDFRLKEIVNFAFTAIEGFSSDNIPWCVGESVFYCRVQYMLDSIDLRYPYNRILYYWFPHMQTTTTSTTTEAPGGIITFERRTDDFDEGNVDFNDFITESPEVSSVEDEDSNENRLEKFNSVFKRR